MASEEFRVLSLEGAVVTAMPKMCCGKVVGSFEIDNDYLITCNDSNITYI